MTRFTWRPEALLFLGALAIHALGAKAARAAERETLFVPGLGASVEVIRDRWGISHIYARNEHDLFFAQGFFAARDRLFQLEMWRRQATGTVAEILGPRELKRDVGARLHRFRGGMRRELAHYHPRGAAIVGAFVEGINAYVARTDADPTLLPVEFKLLGIKPGRWTAEVVVSRHNGLFSNIHQELAYAQSVRVLGVEHVKRLALFEGGDPVLAMDPKIDVSLIGPHVLDVYKAFRDPLRFAPEDVLPLHRAATASTPAGVEAASSEAAGSNNWVLSGRLTQSRHPIVANDPHRPLGAPSLRTLVHLVAPGWNVIGGGEPAIPGVAIGHNEHGAWGLTSLFNDAEDLYVYDTNPADPNQYRYRGRWEAMKVIKETIPVEGQAPVTVELRYTRHGPVLHRDEKHHAAYALRAAWLDIGAAPYLVGLRMDQARSWQEFRQACAYYRAPSSSLVWADRSGDIGWQSTGVQPRRATWSGLVPVPGDGRYEWKGYLPPLELPHAVNPAKGFWATANSFQIPPDYRHRDSVHFVWYEPFRVARVEEVLGSGRVFGVAETAALQQDRLSVPARALVPLLAGLTPPTPRAADALKRLGAWDFVLDGSSIAAGIYVAWEERLRANVRQRLVPEQALGVFPALNLKKVVDILVAPDGRFGEDPIAGRDALLLRSLTEALAALEKKLGPDVARWQYGQQKYKHARILHPLSQSVTAALRDKLDVGTLPRGGYEHTVDSTSGADNQRSGATFRVVVDTADWDNSVATNAPGQSGDPDDAHYRDLFALWASGKYFPLAFSRPKVESVAERVIRLDAAP